jgi:DNA-binding MarR family transcriptional regulator
VRTHGKCVDAHRSRVERYGVVVTEDVDRIGAWAALIKVHAAVVPLLERELAEGKGLPLAWYDLLLVLNAAPGRRLRMSELGEQAVLSRTRVSRVVTELEAAGLVVRQTDDEDRRSAFAALTSEGRASFRAAAPTYVRGIEKYFAQHLTDDEVRVITRALTKVLNAQGG